MPRKRSGPKPEDQPKRRQYNVGFGPEFADRIDATAETLGLDEVNFLRMVIRENLSKYEKRAAAIRAGEEPE